MDRVPQWHRFEARLTAARRHEDPLHSGLKAEFRHESGDARECEGFWDGGLDWRLRFSPNLPGQWTWRSHCDADSALDASGAFECAACESPHALYRHGAVSVGASGTHFEHADGLPFFWLGDTAWNGPLKSRAEDWEIYLADRQRKRFSVIQFVATQWLAAAGDEQGRRAYNGRDPLAIDPVFFRRLDRRIDAINAHGMLAAPVLAWAAPWNAGALDLNPGTSLSDDQVIALSRYIVARYGAHHAAWILAADADYRGDAATRWRRIGRAVFGESGRLATMHPGGRIWVASEFAGEPWFRFNGYQSGHWREPSIEWITKGEPSLCWNAVRPMAHVDLEICYEAHEDFGERRPFSAADVRRAAWSTLLAAPPAGFTYGAHGIWSWEAERNEPMNHPNTGPAPVWRDALDLPGADSMMHLRDIVESISWHRLRPWPEPGVPAAISAERDLALVYLPDGRDIPAHLDLQPRCLDAETGAPASPEGAGDRVVIYD